MSEEDARLDPDALASFKALRLNMGVSDVDRAVLLDAEAWVRAEGLPRRDGSGEFVVGIDLGGNAAMSAAAAYWRTGQLDAFAVFPELPGLAQRGIADGVGRLYQKMADRGELIQAGQRVSDIPTLLVQILARWGRPAAIVCDRWREAELRQALDARPVSNLRADNPWDGLQGRRGGRESVSPGHPGRSGTPRIVFVAHCGYVRGAGDD